MQITKVYHDDNYRELIGNGKEIFAGGDRRLLAATPKPAGHDASLYSKPFSDQFKRIPRDQWPERIKEQKAKKARISDHQKFAPHDQNGLPTCWANGPAHAGTTVRVIQGLPLIYLSACSLAVPISGGHSGGYEGEALEYMVKHGAASQDVWSNNDTSRLDDKGEVQESRKNHFALEAFEMDGFDDFATACLMTLPTAMAFNWWSHVISGGDLIDLGGNEYTALRRTLGRRWNFSAARYAICYRNNWGSWGDKNDYGFMGYVTMSEGKGTPDSGFALRQMTPSLN